MTDTSFKKNNNKKKKAIVASVALLAVGLGGAAFSGAYFTDQATAKDNVLQAGTVQITAGTQDGKAVTFDNVLPIAAADVEADAETTSININNIGTSTINWATAIAPSVAPTAGKTDIGSVMQVQTSTDGGSTWSTASTLDALKGAYTAADTTLDAGASTTVELRVWLPETAGNEYQAEKVTFDVNARAIQANTDAAQFADDANFADVRDITPGS